MHRRLCVCRNIQRDVPQTYHDIPERLDPFDVEAFEKNPMEFYIVCTDVVTGKAYYKRLDRIGSDGYDWIRASASMPLVSQIV